jgi:hypothetical protein
MARFVIKAQSATTDKPRPNAMQAIEFNATIRNGVIEVPEPYRSRFTQPVRVLLL